MLHSEPALAGGLLPCPEFLKSGDDTARFILATAGIVRDLDAIARSVSLDRETDPRRVLPTIPPAVLWRIWPRVMERAADLADIYPGVIPAASADFLRAVADTIETGKAAPTIVPAPTTAEGVYGYVI